jgi:hypothetical protein
VLVNLDGRFLMDAELEWRDDGWVGGWMGGWMGVKSYLKDCLAQSKNV